MTKSLILTTLLFSASAFASKDGGTVYICSNADNSIKITADLSVKKQNGVAVVLVDGIRQQYSEGMGRKKKYLFLLGAVKNTTLQIKKDQKSPVLVSLEIDPDNSHSQLAHEGEGVSVNKFDAFLTVSNLKVTHEVVSCLETKWHD